MRRSFTPLLPSVGLHHLLVVDRQPLVGVDRHTEQPRVRLRESEMEGRDDALTITTLTINCQFTGSITSIIIVIISRSILFLCGHNKPNTKIHCKGRSPSKRGVKRGLT